jgi:hypothetical protein
MTTLHFENAIGKLHIDFLRAPSLKPPVSRLKGFASFVQPDNLSHNIRLNIRACIPEGKREYQLSLDGGLTGSIGPSPNKTCELDPDYEGAIGKCGEFQVQGWKRRGYILLRIRSEIAVHGLSRAQQESNFF